LSSPNKRNKKKSRVHRKSIIPKLINKERNEKVEFTKQKNLDQKQRNKKSKRVHRKSIIPKLINKERNEKVEFTKQKNQTKKLT
jgi:hypothetical protein